MARNFYRASMDIFYPRIDWRGDTPSHVELEITTLDRLAARGGHCWFVHRRALEPDNLQALADQHYRLVAACPPGYLLYDLQPSQ
jgi:hypothetical protein